MYKIINKDNVKFLYNPKSMQILLDKKRYSDSIELELASSYSLKNINSIDGFNYMDFQIVSEELKNIIEPLHAKDEAFYKTTTLYFNGQKLNKKYFTIVLFKYESISAIGSNYIDPTDNACFPVKTIDAKYNLFSDKELFFPVIVEKIINKIKESKCNVKFFKYPKCKGIEEINNNYKYITPLSGILGETCLISTPACNFYQCSESGYIWLSEKAFFKDIQEIVEKYPHRRQFYKKIGNRWYPNLNYSYELFDTIISEEKIKLECMLAV